MIGNAFDCFRHRGWDPSTMCSMIDGRPRRSRVRTSSSMLLMVLGALLVAFSVFLDTQSGQKFLHRPALDYFRTKVCRTCELEGYVGDCGCDFQTVNRANTVHYYPLLRTLVNSTFFRYFKVNLGKDCPFWHCDLMCHIRDCAVQECEPSEVPPAWIEKDIMQCKERAMRPEGATAGAEVEVGPELQKALGSVDRKEAAAGVDHFSGWAEGDNAAVWIEQDDEEEGMTYINLIRNPERFTGYSGVAAWRVWSAIYDENCFEMGESNAKLQCYEKRVFFRLISGLQSSISTHIALELFDRNTNQWVRNTKMFVDKVGAHPERIHNLYFTYLFVLRAISKAGKELTTYHFDTGNPLDDAAVSGNVTALVMASSSDAPKGSSSSKVVRRCQRGFDETGMFRPRPASRRRSTGRGMLMPYAGPVDEEDMVKLRQDIFLKFHNISRIMDCVGCEKCRLWGKLQTLGLGTAIKINLGVPADKKEGSFRFQRNEVIALINTAHQLAKSIDAVEEWQEHEFDEIVSQWSFGAGVALILLGLVLWSACWRRRGRIVNKFEPRSSERGPPVGHGLVGKKDD